MASPISKHLRNLLIIICLGFTATTAKADERSQEIARRIKDHLSNPPPVIEVHYIVSKEVLGQRVIELFDGAYQTNAFILKKFKLASSTNKPVSVAGIYENLHWFLDPNNFLQKWTKTHINDQSGDGIVLQRHDELKHVVSRK